MFEMTTIKSGTRIRKSHTVFGDVITSVNANVTVQGDEVWTAPEDGAEVKKGDQWLHVTSPAVGWMAFTHKGEPICKDLHEVVTEPPADPPYSAEFVMLPQGGIDKIIIHGPKGAHANIFYDDGDGLVIAGF